MRRHKKLNIETNLYVGLGGWYGAWCYADFMGCTTAWVEYLLVGIYAFTVLCLWDFVFWHLFWKRRNRDG